jgi:hypothetical protein
MTSTVKGDPLAPKTAVNDVISPRYGLHGSPADDSIPSIGIAAEDTEAADRDGRGCLQKNGSNRCSMAEKSTPSAAIGAPFSPEATKHRSSSKDAS